MAGHEPYKLIAMAVDSDNGCRMRLKTATQAVTFFKAVTLLHTTHDALTRLESAADDFDIIFLSERLRREEIDGLIKRAKETPHGQDAAFILLLSGTTQDDTAKAAQSLLSGFDGCLSEPYSVESLTEISRLSTQIKHGRQEAREKAAVTFLLNDIMKQIDRLAYIKGADVDVGDNLRRLRDACSTFSSFDGDAMARYHEIAANVFEMAKPDAVVTGRLNYRGTSKRIKKKMATKLINQSDQAAKISKDSKKD